MTSRDLPTRPKRQKASFAPEPAPDQKHDVERLLRKARGLTGARTIAVDRAIGALPQWMKNRFRVANEILRGRLRADKVTLGAVFAPSGSHRRRPLDLKSTDMRCYQEIAVMPATGLYFDNEVLDGGPIWPDYATNPVVQHYRDGVAVGRNARLLEAPKRRIESPCVWGGFLCRHFGHFTAEYASRLPVITRQRPSDLYLFTVWPLVGAEGVPEHLWQVLQWYGIRREQVRLVTEPVTVSVLNK